MRALVLALALSSGEAAAAEIAVSDLREFTSDGCSLFPDGTAADRAKWCDCCLRHDIAYWRGGTEAERKRADEELRDCVLERTRNEALSNAMYLGVRTGGHPVFPTWYRWAYGWPYGRGYQALSAEELLIAGAKIERYRMEHPKGYCGEKQPAPGPEQKGGI